MPPPPPTDAGRDGPPPATAQARRDAHHTALARKHLEQSQESTEPRQALPAAELSEVNALADKLRSELAGHRHGDLVGQIVGTAVKLLSDQTNRGDLKLINTAVKELRYALKTFAPYSDVRKVSIFGSARTLTSHADYRSASELGRRMAEAGWMIITGAGGGIMAAGHGGAGAKPSFGLNISLPFEQSANEHIADDPKLINFKYFFTRKLMFLRASHAIAVYPGGFGTMDEGFEVLTLVQTGKSVPVPIIFVDRPGGDYWRQWQDYVEQQLLERKLISPDDLRLYKVTDSVDEAVRECRHFYSNYHSLRYTKNLLVIRLHRRPTERQVAEIAEEFADISAGGEFRATGPLKVERNEPALSNLHRLCFPFNRRDHGRLRMLIDHLNVLPA